MIISIIIRPIRIKPAKKPLPGYYFYLHQHQSKTQYWAEYRSALRELQQSSIFELPCTWTVLHQRQSLTTTSQHAEGSLCITRFQNDSFCLYHGGMWHTNATCHSLQITFTSKVTSNMLFVREIAAILSLFIFLLNYYSSFSKSFSFYQGEREDVKKIRKCV